MKQFLAISSIIFCSLFLINCKKKDPQPCDECLATPFTSGFKTNVVGKWRFYKIAWLQGSNLSYKDTIDLGTTYEIEIHENGIIDYYRNDTLISTKKLMVWFDEEFSPPSDNLGTVVAYLNCVVGDNPYTNEFSSVLLNMDTLRVSYQPFVYVNEATFEESGKGFYYRKH